MIESFLLRAWCGGAGLAMMAGSLGCFVLWQRLAYFGDALAHAMLLGSIVALISHFQPLLGMLLMVVIFAIVLRRASRRDDGMHDSLLGILAQGSLAVAMVLVSLVPQQRPELMTLLLGDVLALSNADVSTIGVCMIVELIWLWYRWPALLLLTVQEDVAAAEGVPVNQIHYELLLGLGMVVALAIHYVGMLLILGLLIIPAATARLISRAPESMACAAMLCGVVSVSLGLCASCLWDVAAGPAMVTSMLGLYALMHIKMLEIRA
jgi:zinc transport system permease protein